MEAAKRFAIGRKLAIAGCACQIGLPIGIIGTVIGMVRAFHTISAGGPGKLEVLSDDIGLALIATEIGILVAVPGLICIGVALFGCRYRAQWFFSAVITIAALLLLAFPIGTVGGVILLVYVMTRRAEFRVAELRAEQPGEGPVSALS